MEVCNHEVCIAEVLATEVGANRTFLTPLVPGLEALLEDIKVFRIGHWAALPPAKA
jgi:hypothetical protein